MICVADDDSPKCGWISRVRYSILDENLVDFTDTDSTYTANVTFRPIKRKKEQPDYYIALIGYAFELDHDFVSFKYTNLAIYLGMFIWNARSI